MSTACIPVAILFLLVWNYLATLSIFQYHKVERRNVFHMLLLVFTCYLFSLVSSFFHCTVDLKLSSIVSLCSRCTAATMQYSLYISSVCVTFCSLYKLSVFPLLNFFSFSLYATTCLLSQPVPSKLNTNILYSLPPP